MQDTETNTHAAPLTKRAAQAAEMRRRLIDAAVDRFAAAHYDDVAVADIAKDVGVAHGLLFHYFGSKRGIYLAAMHEAAAQLDAAFLLDPTLSPSVQIRQALTAHLRYVAAHRGLALRLVLGGRGADFEAWQVFESARERSMIGVAVSVGLDPDNLALRMMGRSAVAAIDEATVIWLNEGEPFGIDAMVESMVAMVTCAFGQAHALDPGLDVDNAIAALAASAPSRTRRPTRTPGRPRKR